MSNKMSENLKLKIYKYYSRDYTIFFLDFYIV